MFSRRLCPSLTQRARELLQNGGFESGAFAPGWSTRSAADTHNALVYSASDDTGPVYEGTFSVFGFSVCDEAAAAADPPDGPGQSPIH